MGETMPINYARFKRRAFPRVGQTDKQDDLLVAVRESIAALQRAVRYLSLGLDYRKLHRFSQYTPDFAVLSNGDINFFDEKTRRREDEKTRRREDEKTRRREDEKKWDTSVLTQEALDFCIEFVIESAFHLQEVDYT